MASFEFPAYYKNAEKAAADGQRQYMGAVRLRLGFLILAAVGGAISVTAEGNDPFAWLAFGAFLASLGCELYLYAASPEKLWFEGRAAAESTKTLAWRYAVGATPFPLAEASGGAALDPEEVLRRQIQAVSAELTRVVATSTSFPATHITAGMRSTRKFDFSTRVSLYESERIDDQIQWYSTSAEKNAKRQNLFLLLTIVFEVAGVVGAVLRVTGTVDLDALGILAAVVSGLASWSQTRQYGSLSTSYSIAAHELSSIKSAVQQQGPAQWANFVGEAEEAISREHTLWLASRGVLLRRTT